MIAFLRKIRMSLIGSNSFHKYFLYALGEIILVVIGILIALQINNWNEAKKYAETEAYVLNEILNNLHEDEEQLKVIVERRKEVKEAIERLLNILPNPSKRNVDISDDVSTFLFFERYYPLNNAFEMMKSTGIRITNKPLRTDISRYYDFEQAKISQSIKDVEEVILRILNSRNPILSNLLNARSSEGQEVEFTIKNLDDVDFREYLLEEVIPFRGNNQATFNKSSVFLRLNQELIEKIEIEISNPRLSKYLKES